MQYRKYLPLILLLIILNPPNVKSEQLSLFKHDSSGKLVLEDLVVYGKRPSNDSVYVVTDEDLVNRQAWQLIKRALEDTERSSTGFTIEFAPGSTVMTATGKEKLDLIASSMKFIDKDITFELYVGPEIRPSKEATNKLQISRARAIAAYFKRKRQIDNRIIVPGDEDSPLVLNSRFQKASAKQQNVILVNLGKTSSQSVGISAQTGR